MPRDSVLAILICSAKPSTRPGKQGDLSAFAPISAASYFSQALEVDPPSRNIAFRAYYTPSSLAGLPDTKTGKRKRGSVLVCHHGGGSAGTTFACLAKSVQELSHGELGVLAFDARDHGTCVISHVPCSFMPMLMFVHHKVKPRRSRKRTARCCPLTTCKTILSHSSNRSSLMRAKLQTCSYAIPSFPLHIADIYFSCWVILWAPHQSYHRHRCCKKMDTRLSV